MERFSRSVLSGVIDRMTDRLAGNELASFVSDGSTLKLCGHDPRELRFFQPAPR